MQSLSRLTSRSKAAVLLLGGLAPLFRNIRTVIADAGHQASSSRATVRQGGLATTDRQTPQRAFKITGLTWMWSAASLGFAAIGRLARITSTACRAPKRLSNCLNPSFCQRLLGHE